MSSESSEMEQAIRDGIAFVDELGRQVEALRDVLTRQLKAKDWSSLGLKLGKQDEDWDTTSSGWATRVQIDTFELQWRRAGRAYPAIFGAFQISLTPADKGQDAQFIPHVAVLLSGDPRGREQEMWECDDFRLDDAYLGDKEGWEGDPWIKDGEQQWKSADGFDLAFVVPLVELRSDSDTSSMIIEPLMTAADLIVRRIASKGSA